MNYAMITNYAHACTNPLPLGEPESQKIGFIALILKFLSAKNQQNHKHVM